MRNFYRKPSSFAFDDQLSLGQNEAMINEEIKYNMEDIEFQRNINKMWKFKGKELIIKKPSSKYRSKYLQFNKKKLNSHSLK